MKNNRSKQPVQDDRGESYFDNLARITSTLVAALLALLTFFLVVGAQNSVKGFSSALYTAVALLGSGLVLYAVGHATRECYYNTKKDKLRLIASKLLRSIRILQQLVFIASMGAVVWFAISYAQLFLNPKPVQPPAASQQNPPSNPAEPAPGETAEQHAKEQEQQKAKPTQ